MERGTVLSALKVHASFNKNSLCSVDLHQLGRDPASRLSLTEQEAMGRPRGRRGGLGSTCARGASFLVIQCSGSLQPLGSLPSASWPRKARLFPALPSKHRWAELDISLPFLVSLPGCWAPGAPCPLIWCAAMVGNTPGAKSRTRPALLAGQTHAAIFQLRWQSQPCSFTAPRGPPGADLKVDGDMAPISSAARKADLRQERGHAS